MCHAAAPEKLLRGPQKGSEYLGLVFGAETTEMTDASLIAPLGAELLGQGIDLCGNSSHIAAVASRQPEANFRTAQKRIGFWREGFLALHHQGRSPGFVVLMNGEGDADETPRAAPYQSPERSLLS